LPKNFVNVNIFGYSQIFGAKEFSIGGVNIAAATSFTVP